MNNGFPKMDKPVDARLRGTAWSNPALGEHHFNV